MKKEKIDIDDIKKCSSYRYLLDRLRCLYERGIIDSNGFLTDYGMRILEEYNLNISDILSGGE